MTDQVQTRTLSIRALMDSGDYARGAREIVEANRQVSTTGKEVAVTLTETQGRLSAAADPAGRLGRTYDQAAVSQQRFASDLVGLNRALEENRITSERAGAIYAGMVAKLHLAADSTDIARQGYVLLGDVVEQTNRRMAEARALAIATRDADLYGQKAMALRAQLDPVGASQNRLNAEIAEYTVLMDRAQITTGEFAAAQAMAQKRHDDFVASLNRTPVGVNDNINMTSSRDDGFRRQNLGYQLMDIGQSSAMGMPMGMIMMQQGPQIAQLYAAQGGLNAAMRDFSVILGGVARVAGPVVGVLASLYGVYSVLQANSVKAGLAVDETTRKLAEQAAPVSALKGQIGELTRLQADYNKALAESQQIGLSASNVLVANTKREYEARKALLELELLLQEAKLKTMQADASIAGQEMRERVAGAVTLDPSRATRQGFADPRINGGIPFVQLPDEISGLQKTLDALDADPAKNKIARMRAEITIAELAVQSFRDALKKPFEIGGDPLADSYWSRFSAAMLAKEKAYRDMQNPVPNFPNGVPTPTSRPIDGEDVAASVAKTEKAYDQLVRSSDQRIASLRNEIAISGELVDVQGRLRAEFDAEAQYREQVVRAGGTADPREIAVLREKAALIATLNSQLAAQKTLQTQNDDLERLRLEASLVGASADARGRAIAALEAEQQLRSQGISLLSQEGQLYVQNAQAMASARVAIEQQTAAYSSLQNAGASAIDQLVQGNSSLEDITNSLLSTVKTLAISNPLSNMMLGTNLPSAWSLFGGQASVPGATSTGTMTVNAATVMINGAPVGTGLLPGMTTGSGLGSLLGLNQAPANSNVAAGSVEAYIRQRAPLYGIDPTTAVNVARSEGGLTSWNQQSNVINSQGLREQSFGPYQLYMGGGLGNQFQSQTSLDPRYAANGPAGVDYALDYASKNGWGSWYGARNSGISNWQGIGQRPAIDPAATDATASLQKLSTTTATANSSLTTLGASTDKLGSTFSSFLSGGATPTTAGAGYFPPAPSGYFPPAPTTATSSGGGLFSLLFGWIPKLFGFENGTSFAPGGPSIVGERGPEIVDLPLGARVTPNRELMAGLSGGKPAGGTVVNIHNYTSGRARVEEHDDGNGNRRVEVVLEEANGAAISRPGSATRSALEEQYRVAPRIKQR